MRFFENTFSRILFQECFLENTYFKNNFSRKLGFQKRVFLNGLFTFKLWRSLANSSFSIWTNSTSSCCSSFSVKRCRFNDSNFLLSALKVGKFQKVLSICSHPQKNRTKSQILKVSLLVETFRVSYLIRFFEMGPNWKDLMRFSHL